MIILYLTGAIIACASSSEKDIPRGSAPARAAAYSQDNFTFDKIRKERSENNFEFYYKHCSVDERHPFPVGAIWQCTDP